MKNISIQPRKIIMKRRSVGWSESIGSVRGFGRVNHMRLIENFLDDNLIKTTKKTSKPYFRMNEKY